MTGRSKQFGWASDPLDAGAAREPPLLVNRADVADGENASGSGVNRRWRAARLTENRQELRRHGLLALLGGELGELVIAQ